MLARDKVVVRDVGFNGRRVLDGYVGLERAYVAQIVDLGEQQALRSTSIRKVHLGVFEVWCC